MLLTLHGLTMAKSELLSVRVEEETADRIEELVELEREEAPDSLSELDKKDQPQVLRKIIRVGLDTVAEGESDVQRLRDRIDELEGEVEQLEQVKTRPTVAEWVEVTRHAPLPVKSFLFPAFLAAGLFVASATAFQFAEYLGVDVARSASVFLLVLSFLSLLGAVVFPVTQVIVDRLFTRIGG